MSRDFVRHSLGLVAAVLVTVAAPAGAQWSSGSGAPEPAAVSVHAGAVEFFPVVDYSRAILTVSRGDTLMRWVFSAGERPAIERFDPDGNYLVDGVYGWELELIPDAEAARALRLAASEASGKALDAWQRQSGSVAVQGGAFVSPDIVEPGEEGRAARSSFASESLTPSRFESNPWAVDADDSGTSEAEARAAAADAFTPAERISVGEAMGFDDSDFMASAAGQPLEPTATSSMQPLEARSALRTTRSIEPGGKNGRPEKEQE